MRRFFTILLFCCLYVVSLNAQPKCVPAGFNAGSKSEGGISAILGQPFSAHFSTGGHKVTEGVLQVYAKACGQTVFDGDHNPYATVSVAGYCWTKSNLRATHYADGVGTAIERSSVYHAPGHDDEAENENTYGRLYTWFSAVQLPEDGSGTLTPDANGYVRGACPDGWHIPTETEMDALLALNVEDLRTPELWVTPNNNNNSTDFTSLPAGMYNATKERFEGLHSQTTYWSLANGTQPPTTIMVLEYYCDLPVEEAVSAHDMLSIRCVKNNN